MNTFLTTSLIALVLVGAAIKSEQAPLEIAAPKSKPLQVLSFSSNDGRHVLTVVLEKVGPSPGSPHRAQLYEAHWVADLGVLAHSYSDLGVLATLPPALQCESGAGSFTVMPKSGNWETAVQSSDFTAVFTPAPAQK
jgi:hypothetical protein